MRAGGMGKKIWHGGEGMCAKALKFSEPRRLDFFGGMPLRFIFIKEKRREKEKNEYKNCNRWNRY